MTKKNRKSVKKVAHRSPFADQPEIEIIERAGNGNLESASYSAFDLDCLLDETAEGGGWSPSYNRLQHAVLTAWNAVHAARPDVRHILLTFPEKSE